MPEQRRHDRITCARSRGTGRWIIAVASLVLLSSGLAAGPDQIESAPDRKETVSRLDAWREVQEICKEAIRAPQAAERIERCEKFLKEHGGHEDQKPLLQALIDAYIDEGDYDSGRVARLVEQLASLDDGSFTEPVQLLNKYHLKHGLPLDSAERLAAMNAERIERERLKLARIDDEDRRKSRQSTLDYYTAQGQTLVALLRVRQGNGSEALELLRETERLAARLAQGIIVYDERGQEVRRFSTGMLDELHLALAAALKETGDADAARVELGRISGFFGEETLKEMHRELLADLDIERPRGVDIASDPLPAPDFTLKDLEGNEVSLSDLRGKVVLLNFWATWCGPCRMEMPILQRFWKSHQDKGVVMLAVSTDQVNDRSQIEPFLEANNLDVPVLLEDAEQLTGYDYSGIPALYVIDREGRIAVARTGYDPDMKEKLENTVLDIIEGGATPGQTLVTIEHAPEGFGLLWMTPVEGDADVLTVASPVGSQAGEIGMVGRQGLMRYSADGRDLGAAPLQGWHRGLEASDLDADGRREWILTGYRDVKVLDSQGQEYWQNEPGASAIRLVGVADLDGDRMLEIVLQGRERIVAMKHVPEPLWRYDDFSEAQAVRRNPTGGLLAQLDGKIYIADAAGNFRAWAFEVEDDYTLSGSIDLGGERRLDFFEGRWDRSPQLDHDVDGDGVDDVVVVSWNGVTAHDAEGNLLLRIHGEDTSFSAALGDLDGRPGDELVLFVRHYGLVTLGRAAGPSEVAGTR